jgi:hypothetical protein
VGSTGRDPSDMSIPDLAEPISAALGHLSRFPACVSANPSKDPPLSLASFAHWWVCFFGEANHVVLFSSFLRKDT